MKMQVITEYIITYIISSVYYIFSIYWGIIRTNSEVLDALMAGWPEMKMEKWTITLSEILQF